MTFYWARNSISYITAISLVVALVVGVFSQSHAAVNMDVAATEAEPCSGHMTAPVVTEDNCLTLCDAAELGPFVGLLKEQRDAPEPTVSLVTYAFTVPLKIETGHAGTLVAVRGPPDKDIYLKTQRLRL